MNASRHNCNSLYPAKAAPHPPPIAEPTAESLSITAFILQSDAWLASACPKWAGNEAKTALHAV
jgi:hypothetical protein